GKGKGAGKEGGKNKGNKDVEMASTVLEVPPEIIQPSTRALNLRPRPNEKEQGETVAEKDGEEEHEHAEEDQAEGKKRKLK
ncbi:unnamed protein product, partial [Amoebophrya sp. A120]